LPRQTARDEAKTGSRTSQGKFVRVPDSVEGPRSPDRAQVRRSNGPMKTTGLLPGPGSNPANTESSTGAGWPSSAHSLNMEKRIWLPRIAGLLRHAEGHFYQIGCDRESVGLGNRLLQFTCIGSIGGVA
jgi:hypothetical protein